MVLSHLGQVAQSLAAARRARELDPLNVSHQALSSQIAFVARDYPQAIQPARQVITLDPAFWVGYVQLGQAYEQTGSTDLALDALTHAGRLSGGNTAKRCRCAVTFWPGSEQPKEVESVLYALEAVAPDRDVPPYAAALIYAGLGDDRAALERVEKALASHDVHLAFLTCDPKWDELKSRPGFQEIIVRCAFDKPAGSATLPAIAH